MDRFNTFWVIEAERNENEYPWFRRLKYYSPPIPELANSIENAIAIAFLSPSAIAIDMAIFQLLLLLLLLIRPSSNY